MEEVSEARRGEVMSGHVSEKQYFVVGVECNWKPVELLQDRYDVTSGWGSSGDMRC